MSQGCSLVELEGLRVTVDKLVYRHLPDTERPHSFVYFITIHNESEVPVTIRGRKWVVNHGNGSTQVVEGDGVVGQTPTIPPGGRFSYNSQHLVDDLGAIAEGAYLGVDGLGRRVVTRIPRFKMSVPVA
jgi:ApaG protein